MNKVYHKLYKKDSCDSIRELWMEQQGDLYRTHSGVKGGTTVTNEWTRAESKNTGKKNATTAIEQATAEIEAKYTKKIKEGYFTDISQIDKGCSYVEPMLAKKYRDYEDKINLSSSTWGLQLKFNGNRCIATKDGLYTRKGEKYVSVPHIKNALDSFFKQYPNAILDGELFNYDLRQKLNEISKLIRRTVNITSKDLKQSEQKVKFYVYDGYNFSKELNQDASYTDRKNWIDKNVVGKIKYIEEVKTYSISNKSELEKQYKTFVEDGQEGGILRNLTEGYENKRSKNLLKMKPTDSDEAIIKDIQEGKADWSGAGKVITLDWNGKVFNATFKGTYEDCVKFLKEKKQWIGKTITFNYNGLTGLGNPNYAQFDYNNCISVDK